MPGSLQAWVLKNTSTKPIKKVFLRESEREGGREREGEREREGGGGGGGEKERSVDTSSTTVVFQGNLQKDVNFKLSATKPFQHLSYFLPLQGSSVRGFCTVSMRVKPR